MATKVALPNYVRKLQYLRRIGAIPQEAGLFMVDVFHDDWCDIYQARRCNCDPDIRLNARSLSSTLPVGAMLLACDFSPMAERVAARGEVPVLPVWGRHDRIVPASTGREFGELVGEEVRWVRGGHPPQGVPDVAR